MASFFSLVVRMKSAVAKQDARVIITKQVGSGISELTVPTLNLANLSLDTADEPEQDHLKWVLSCDVR